MEGVWASGSTYVDLTSVPDSYHGIRVMPSGRALLPPGSSTAGTSTVADECGPTVTSFGAAWREILPAANALDYGYYGCEY